MPPFFWFGDSIYANAQFYLNRSEYEPHGRSLVIIPLLTANAYDAGGFYDYYSGSCDTSCLSIHLHDVDLAEQSSAGTVNTLAKLGYEFTNDYHLDLFLRTDPAYLERYQKVIVLHSEYVTYEIYGALQAHPKVVYLSPNAMYGRVTISENNVMVLVEGHGYGGKYNGFGWPYENTPEEYDKSCDNWRFRTIHNGWQLNCNPELTIRGNLDLLKELARF